MEIKESYQHKIFNSDSKLHAIEIDRYDCEYNSLFGGVVVGLLVGVFVFDEDKNIL